MLSRLFGNYMVEKNLIDKQKLDSLFPVNKELRADLCTVAVLRKVLTAAQIDLLLSEMDKGKNRFGDFAIDNNILSENEVEKLIPFQINKFYRFVQTLLNEDLIRIESIIPLIEAFKQDNELSDEGMESLIMDDLEKIINYFVPIEESYIKVMLLTSLRTFRRLIDANVIIGKGRCTSTVELDTYSAQILSGDFRVKFYISGEGDNLLGIANYFTDATYDSICEDALDNVGEFINCINGQVATDFSYDDVSVDMGAPEYSLEGCSITGRKFYEIPICANGYFFKVVLDATI